MKRVVITGATSMIGINLIQYMSQFGIEILAIIRKDSKKRNRLAKYTNVTVVECNLEDLQNLSISNKNYDTLIHLAWDVTFGQERNNMYIQNLNVKYTLDAVQLAKRLGCHTFIGAGSQAEYGRVEGLLSNNTPTNPENGYGMAKLCAGQMSRILANQLGIRHIWTRILSIYGPYDGKKTMVMSSIIEMLEGKSPDYTKAEQMWDYLYVEDCAKAIYLLGEKGQNNQIYCIGSGKKKPLKEYIAIIRNQIDPKIELKLGTRDYAPNQVMNLCADIENLTRDTGFVPEIDFQEGIKRTIDWYKGETKNEEN